MVGWILRALLFLIGLGLLASPFTEPAIRIIGVAMAVGGAWLLYSKWKNRGVT